MNNNDTFYKLVRLAGTPFRYRTVGQEHIQSDGPAIYVANHLGSVGPVQVILSVPVRLYPWVIGEMTDFQRAPRYLYDDFVHPAWHLQGRLGAAISKPLSWLAVWIMRGLTAVSVDRNRGRCVDAFHHSLALLAEGKNLLVFPEDATRPPDPETRLHPFLCGFIALCYMHERARGDRLPIYPLAVHPASRTIAVGEAIFFEDNGDRRQDIRRTCERLQGKVRELYARQSR